MARILQAEEVANVVMLASGPESTHNTGSSGPLTGVSSPRSQLDGERRVRRCYVTFLVTWVCMCLFPCFIMYFFLLCLCQISPFPLILFVRFQ